MLMLSNKCFLVYALKNFGIRKKSRRKNSVDCANVEGDGPSETDAQRARKRSRERRREIRRERKPQRERESETRLEIDANKK